MIGVTLRDSAAPAAALPAPTDPHAAVLTDILPPIPTVSEWSLIIMTVLAFTAGTVLFGRRRRAAAA